MYYSFIRAFYRLLDWFLASQSPPIVRVREFLKRHELARKGGRFLLRVVRRLGLLPNELRDLRNWRHRKLHAIMRARAVGGAITLAELMRIWETTRWRPKILVIAGGLEAKQIDIMIGNAVARATRLPEFDSAGGCEVPPLDRFSRVIAAPTHENAKLIDRLQSKFHRPEHFVRVGETGRRSTYLGLGKSNVGSANGSSAGWTLREKLSAGSPLRVALLNDVGFQYGAGNALKRQAASFALMGWDVSLVAQRPGDIVVPPAITGLGQPPTWRGSRIAGTLRDDAAVVDESVMADVTATIQALRSDIVLTGNIHGASWPVTMLPRLRDAGPMVIAYMHDTYFVTGRCAQPLACTKFRTGCDDACPTAHEYPRLTPKKIAAAWQARGDVFSGPRAIPLIANSTWTRDIVLQRFGDAARTGVVHLGLDHELFAPFSKSAARKLLGVPEGKPIVIMGAVDVHDVWKGGPHFHNLHKALTERDDIGLILFGRSSELLASTRSFGLVEDERLMPIILNCADIFVSTARAESFGQTLLEASACALPVVAFSVGGVQDIVVHEQTGFLVTESSTPRMIDAIDQLVRSPTQRERFGRNGRERVEKNFTLAHQGRAWLDCLKSLC